MLTDKRHRSQLYGEYLMNQYFFKVFTNTPKPPQFDQQILQHLHMETIIHEYIHYIHEISTHIGTLSLLYSVTYRSILSNYVEKALGNSGFNNQISQTHADTLLGVDETMTAMIGDDFSAINTKVNEVKSYKMRVFDIQIPHGDKLVSREIEIPSLLIQEGDKEVSLDFGKFFIYEGLAYELEKIFQKNARGKAIDDADGSEYTLMRYLALLIAPNVDFVSVLTIASISLSYVNCGVMFIRHLEQLVKLKLGSTEAEHVLNLKKMISQENEERADLLTGVLDEIDKVYIGRSSLSRAFRSLRGHYISSYQARINNPTFEVDMIVAHDILGLLTLVPPCDYWYVFTDKDDYMRDFAGTSKHHFSEGMEAAEAHRILIAHVHYANVLYYNVLGDLKNLDPGDEEVQCPFYTACDLKFRRESSAICNGRPWETYDLSYHSDKRYCDYGSGVLQTKGINVPLP